MKNKLLFLPALITLLLFGACSSYQVPKSVQNKVLLVKYNEFGNKYLSYPIIGKEWHQWYDEGSDDGENIYVVIYKDTDEATLQEYYPVDELFMQDHRYISYDEAIAHLDKHEDNLALSEDTRNKLSALREKIIQKFGEE